MRRIGICTVGLALLAGMGSASCFNAEGADLSKGKSIYMELCIACHGLDGRGAGSVKLNPPPADLTSAGVQEKLDAGLFKSIYDGQKNKAEVAGEREVIVHPGSARSPSRTRASRPTPIFLM
jgi:mono/diheme cytochrome c family protein